MTEYMNSFTSPLIEETHADLLSSMSTLSLAPRRVILSFKETQEFNQPKDSFYYVRLLEANDGAYEPMFGDLIALTDVRPKYSADLDRPNRPYLVAFVHKIRDNTLTILASKPILAEEQDKNIYAVFLINMTTNIRIWRALNSELEGGNLNIIQRVLQQKSAVRILIIAYFSVAY